MGIDFLELPPPLFYSILDVFERYSMVALDLKSIMKLQHARSKFNLFGLGITLLLLLVNTKFYFLVSSLALRYFFFSISESIR